MANRVRIGKVSCTCKVKLPKKKGGTPRVTCSACKTARKKLTKAQKAERRAKWVATRASNMELRARQGSRTGISGMRRKRRHARRGRR